MRGTRTRCSCRQSLSVTRARRRPWPIWSRNFVAASKTPDSHRGQRPGSGRRFVPSRTGGASTGRKRPMPFAGNSNAPRRSSPFGPSSAPAPETCPSRGSSSSPRARSLRRQRLRRASSCALRALNGRARHWPARYPRLARTSPRPRRRRTLISCHPVRLTPLG